MSLARFKEMVREQYLLVCLDEERAIDALPRLLGTDVGERKAAHDVLEQVLAARGAVSEEGKRRQARVEALFDAKPEKAAKPEPAHA
jgi:hypothetical protein